MSKKMICQVLLPLMLGLGSIARGAKMPQKINNRKDLRVALKAARTPEDHARIAAYYREEADTLDSQAAGYEQAARTYRGGPVVKNLMAPNTAARYERIAKRYREEAQSNRHLAESQEQAAGMTVPASK